MVQACAPTMGKTGFKKSVAGPVGGNDFPPRLWRTIAGGCAWADNVRCVMLPSRYTSPSLVEMIAEYRRQGAWPARL